MRRRIVERAMWALAARTGLELGQAYTVATGVAVAVVLGLLGLPPVLDADGREVAGAPASAIATPSPPTTTLDPAAAIPAPVDPGPPPAPAAPPPQEATFRAPPPAARDVDPTTTTAPTTLPSPRLPVPASPPGTTTVFATVPQPGAPEGVAVGPDGTVYVATNNAQGRGGVGPSEIVAFTASGALIGSFAVDGQPEDRTVGLTGLAVDRRGRPVVADAATDRLLRLDPSRRQLTELVTVPDVGPCLITFEDGPCEPGPIDHAPELRGLTLLPDGAIVVADRGQGLLWRYDGELTVAATIDSRAPGEGPTGVALRGTDLVVVVSGVTDSMPPGDAAVIVIGTDGAATTLATYDPAEAPTDVAVGASGRIYVTLAGADAVETLTDDGPGRRFDGGSVDPGFDAPTGITVDDGRLLVTNQSTVDDDPDHWVVHAIVVDDRPNGP